MNLTGSRRASPRCGCAAILAAGLLADLARGGEEPVAARARVARALPVAIRCRCMATTLVGGTCRRCGMHASKVGMSRHLATCWPRTRLDQGRPHELFHLRIEAERDPRYWLHLEILGSAQLVDIDDFLRRLWLECCGHLSMFRFPSRVDPRARADDEDDDMGRTLATALAGVDHFAYDYDFGSTTSLRLHVVGRQQAPFQEGEKLRILARNDPPTLVCGDCERPASAVCAECFGVCYCDDHAGTHGCSREALLPIVDSPRMGVCGYDGPSVEPTPRIGPGSPPSG